MNNMLFPIVESTNEVLDALETYRGCFIKFPDYVAEGKEAFVDSNRVFDSEILQPLDEKTMFPTTIASLKGKERQVIQQYVNTIHYKPATKDVDLQNDIKELIWWSEQMMDGILVAAAGRYKWSDKVIEDVHDPSEWTLNIARYPFEENKGGEILFPAHKDWGLLAIYPYVHGAGLEVYIEPKAGGYGGWQWLEIPEDCAFCYAGDIFSRITNKVVQPLLHRVSQPTDQAGSRTSIIFYADPIRDMILPSGEKVGDIIDSKLKKIGQIK
jgi:hypothetical protein